MLVFVQGGKPENLEKTPRSRDENQQQTQPTCDDGSANRTPRATAVGGERSRHCAIPGLKVGVLLDYLTVFAKLVSNGAENKKR